MKIRMKDDTLRVRISGPEVEEFSRQGKVSTTTRFGVGPDAVLRYTLLLEEGTEVVKISFVAHEIKVLVPEKLARKWTTTEMVGFEEYIPLNGNAHLYVLVEKDFQCRHKGPNEEDSDAHIRLEKSS